MGRFTFPEGAFFTGSPEIKVTCVKEHDQLVEDALDQEKRRFPNKGLDMDCFLRPASAKERDGHLARLEGVLRLDAFYRMIQPKATKITVYQYGQDVGWRADPSIHNPCEMLSISDKWRRIKYASGARGEKPVEYEHANEKCLYCNGSFDDTIQTELGFKPSGRATVRGPWTQRDEGPS